MTKAEKRKEWEARIVRYRASDQSVVRPIMSSLFVV